MFFLKFSLEKNSEKKLFFKIIFFWKNFSNLKITFFSFRFFWNSEYSIFFNCNFSLKIPIIPFAIQGFKHHFQHSNTSKIPLFSFPFCYKFARKDEIKQSILRAERFKNDAFSALGTLSDSPEFPVQRQENLWKTGEFSRISLGQNHGFCDLSTSQKHPKISVKCPSKRLFFSVSLWDFDPFHTRFCRNFGTNWRVFNPIFDTFWGFFLKKKFERKKNFFFSSKKFILKFLNKKISNGVFSNASDKN